MPVVQTCPWNSYKHIYNYIYMIIVGKSMPIDKYEQYKRVINQFNGRLYMRIYIRKQEIVVVFCFCFFNLVCVW